MVTKQKGMKNMIFKNPKTFKGGSLIMGQYRVVDLILLIGGFSVSIIGLTIFLSGEVDGFILLFYILICLFPGVLAFILTSKIPGYHNALEFLVVCYQFYKKYQKNYMWEGVIINDESE